MKRNKIDKDSILRIRNIPLFLGILIMLIVVALLVIESIIGSEIGIARANLYVNAVPIGLGLMLFWMIM